jgi:3'-phosphoadenosine 5'-phosphosulfate sulfotransferase (PAPS reductase)/FAD synthetase
MQSETRPAFRIESPALISFSGGRTSAYMLHEILRAYDGRLPDDAIVAFANTGREYEKTLSFVHECSVRWGVHIHWVEWRDEANGFERVDLSSASRLGEPFEALITKKKALPNWQARWCTSILKIKPLHALMRSKFGLAPGDYAEVVGFRSDEEHRIEDMVEADAKTGRKRTAPLARAKISKRDVLRFWLGENADPLLLTHPLPQGFDLGLPLWKGNCDLCFATGRKIRKLRIRSDPPCAHWWAHQEARIGATFDRRDSISELVEEVEAEPEFLFDAVDDGFDAECGDGGCDINMMEPADA